MHTECVGLSVPLLRRSLVDPVSLKPIYEGDFLCIIHIYIYIYISTCIWSIRLGTDRRTDRCRREDRRTDRQANRQADGKQTGRQIEKPSHRQKDELECES